MAASRKPGPLGVEGAIPNLEDGTMARIASPRVGPVGSDGGKPPTAVAPRPGQRKSAGGLPVLRQNARGKYVRWLQILLNQHRAAQPALQEDGIFGPETLAAVTAFQRSSGLASGGIVDVQTWMKVVAPPVKARMTATVNGTSAVLPPQKVTPASTVSVADWPLTRRFEEVLKLTPNHLKPEAAALFRAMLTPLNLGIAVGTLAAWAVSHAFGVGEAADVILGVVGVIFLGLGAFTAGEDIGECLMITLNAKDHADLDKAAARLAQAIDIIGVMAFFSLLGKVGAKLKGAGGVAEEEAATTATQNAKPRVPEAEEASGYKQSPPRDWNYGPRQTGKVEPGAVPDKPAFDEAILAAKGRTAPAAPEGWPAMPDTAAQTFGADPQPVSLAPGSKLFRVIDSDSGASGSFWSTSPPPASEAGWRAGSAVKGEWNGDGGFVEATVPPEGVNAWSGPAAPQFAGGNGMVLPGGDTQVWVPRGTLTPDGPPQPTPWNPGS